ncbi:Uncharacterised protein [Starkeya nomas]|uniref:DUF917 domain-containing protein n=1 Tax=Starkeya nomas TaxID=2666134 RepID=A0A5S9PRS5_9HYPH|nr:DUF917 domain-containing protein [Starkeya nomas]CAA0107307.1 Uncharacterised protein [Starkeya nomas]
MRSLPRLLETDELDFLATGAWILGTGGGGSPYASHLGVRRFYDEGARITLIDPDELAEDDLVAVVSTMGAPLVFQERMTDAAFAVKPVRAMEDYLGRSFRAVMTVEVGGCNAFQPLLVAAASGLPVVDADAMGRAYPEAQMQSFSIAGLKMYPHAVSDVRDNDVIIARASGWHEMERVRRKVCTEFGSVATTCQAPRTGAEIKRFAVLRTLSQAISLGKEVHRARGAHEDPVEATIRAASGKRLFAGKVIDVQRQTTEGFLRGTLQLDGMEGDAGARFDVAFQNEFTIAWRDGAVTATTPDLICVLDSISGEAIGTESLRFGQRVTVVALPSPAIHCSPEGLAHVGPRAFGYDVDFRSVFEATQGGRA